MAKYEVVNSGSRDHIYTRTVGRFMLEKLKDRGISEELQSDKQGADRRSLFTTAIYNYLHYSSTKQLDQFQHIQDNYELTEQRKRN